MKGGCISLKSSCRDRRSSLVQPSIAQKSFTLEDFKSADFISKFALESDDKLKEMHFQSLVKVINYINVVFNKIRGQIAELESRIINQLVSYHTDSQAEEELNLLRRTLKRCHEKLLNNTQDEPVLIEELASLFNKYENIKKTKCNSLNEYKDQQTETVLQLVQNKLTTAINDSCEIASNQLSVRSASTSQALGIQQPEKLELFELQIDQEACPKVLEVDHGFNKYFFFTIKQESVSALDSISYNIISTKRPQILHSIKCFENSGFDTETLFKQKLFFYTRKLNLIYAQGEDYENNPVVNIYRPAPKGISKIAQIPISLLPFQCNDLQPNTYIEVLNLPHVLAIASNHELALVNILTRKCVKEYFFDDNVMGLKYIKAVNYIAILFKTKMLVYAVLDSNRLSRLRYSRPIQIKGDIQEVFCSGNVILIQDYELDIIRDKHLNVIDDRTANHFNIFEFGEREVREYKVVMKDSECAKNIKSSVHIYNIKILPHQRKFHVYYNVGYNKQGYEKILTYGADQSSLNVEGPAEKFVQFKNNILICEQVRSKR